MMKHKALPILIFFLGTISLLADERVIKNGQTIAEVIKILGEPITILHMSREADIYYPGMTINTVNGVVTNLPDNFHELRMAAQQRAEERDLFSLNQKEKGLVLHEGEWITQSEKSQALEDVKMMEIIVRQKQIEKQPKNQVRLFLEKCQEQKKYGSSSEFIIRRKDETLVDHRALAIPEKVAFVVFTHNGKFREDIWQEIEEIIQNDPDVVLQRFSLSSREHPFAKQYAVTEAPWIRVIDPRGRVLNGIGQTWNPEALREAIEKAKRQTGIGKYAN